MKKVFAFAFLVLFLTASFNQLVLSGLYVLNQDFIAEKFCVNKDKPVMKCKGKCHLTDVLSKTESQKESDNHLLSSSFIIAVYHETYNLKIPEKTEIVCANRIRDIILQSSYYKSIFHPPQVAYFFC